MVPHVPMTKLTVVCLLSLFLSACSANHKILTSVADVKLEKIAQLSDYLMVNPKDASAYHQRGIAFEVIGKNAQAIKDYNKAQALDPHLALVYWNRGLLYYKMQQNDKAITDLSRYLSFRPRSTTATLIRAVIYYKKGAYGKAIAGFRRVARMDVRYTGIAYVNLATVYMERKNYKRAWVYANKKEANAVHNDPKNCFKAGRDMQDFKQFMVLNNHDELLRKLRNTTG